MVSAEQVEEVKRLARQHCSQRAISRETGLARETVRRIIGGQRREPPREPPQIPVFGRQPERCPDCGALVLPPCWACHVRQWNHREALQQLQGQT